MSTYGIYSHTNDYQDFHSLSYNLSNEILRIRDDVFGTLYISWTKHGLRELHKLRKMFLPKMESAKDDDSAEEIIDWLWAVVDDISLGVSHRGRTPPLSEIKEALAIAEAERENPWYHSDYEKYRKREEEWERRWYELCSVGCITYKGGN